MKHHKIIYTTILPLNRVFCRDYHFTCLFYEAKIPQKHPLAYFKPVWQRCHPCADQYPQIPGNRLLYG